MSGGDLTNGISELPPRRDMGPSINVKAWRNIAAAAFVLAGAAMLLTVVLFKLYTDESAARRDQNCLSFEGDHAQEVRDLGDSYSLLLRTARPAWDDTQRFVFERLPQLERNAASDRDRFGARVPAYCDDPGTGLAEPDPCLPRRPAALGPPAVRPPRQRRCRKIVRVADLGRQR